MDTIQEEYKISSNAINFKMSEEDMLGINTLKTTLMSGITNAKEEFIKKSIIDYARKQQEYLGTEVELYLMDEEIAKKIIELGVKEYIKELNVSHSQ